MLIWLRLAAAVFISALPQLAGAAVVASGPGGFVVREETVYAGLPAVAWQRLVRPKELRGSSRWRPLSTACWRSS